jgi:hypothetical protein
LGERANITIRNWRARKVIRQHLGDQGNDMLAKRYATLEALISDHVAYDVPYIRWLIDSTVRGVQGDATAAPAAIANLNEFGSDVVREMATTG